MKPLFLVASIAVASLVTEITPVNAQQVVCRDRGALVQTLATRFDETQRMFGLQSDDRVLELYAAPDGSWTAIVTMPSGKSCVVAAGEAWTEVAPQPVGEPA